MSDVLIWPIGLGILGAVFGSFIATVAVRWPEGRSALAGRSMCDGCSRTLAPFELVPLLSFLLVRGRCRSCDSTIAPSHFVTELLGTGIGISAGLLVPGIEGAAGAVFGWLLLALGALDYAAFWLPNGLTLTLAIAGLATGAIGLPPTLADRATGGVFGFVTLWGAGALYRWWRGRVGIGGGDPKLFGAIGLWMGWAALPRILLVACLVGLAAVVILRLGGRKLLATDRLPLGTLLAASAFALWCAEAISFVGAS